VDCILIGCLYLPNGNPAPGPKLEYKLRWFERLKEHAASLLAQEIIPVILERFPFALAHGPRSILLFDRMIHRSGDSTYADHSSRRLQRDADRA
jgi:hypothetical protein